MFWGLRLEDDHTDDALGIAVADQSITTKASLRPETRTRREAVRWRQGLQNGDILGVLYWFTAKIFAFQMLMAFCSGTSNSKIFLAHVYVWRLSK